MNVVIIRGVLSRAPELRELPSGSRLAQLEVTVRHPARPTASVPVALFEPPVRTLALASGTEVVVTGEVRRRFFRTPAGTGSRTEVVAAQVIPATHRKRVRTALRAAVDGITIDDG